MPVTPEDIYDSAQNMNIPPECESSRRSSASRLYYGFFHFANRYADQNADIPPSTLSGSTHEKLAEFFSSSWVQPVEKRRRIRRVGILLRKCHKSRCAADYRIEEDFDISMLDTHTHDCEQGIQAIIS